MDFREHENVSCRVCSRLQWRIGAWVQPYIWSKAEAHMTEAPKPPEGENILESAFPFPLISRSGSATRLSQTWSLSQPSQFSYVACRGFVKYTRSKVKYRPPKQRMKDWNEIYYSKGKSELKVQAARWVCFLKHHKKLFYWLHFTIIFFNLKNGQWLSLNWIYTACCSVTFIVWSCCLENYNQ